MGANSTTDYGRFKLKKNALPVNLAVASSMSKTDAKKPVIVDKNYVIQEGAERLFACQKQKVAVRYTIK